MYKIDSIDVENPDRSLLINRVELEELSKEEIFLQTIDCLVGYIEEMRKEMIEEKEDFKDNLNDDLDYVLDCALTDGIISDDAYQHLCLGLNRTI